MPRTVVRVSLVVFGGALALLTSCVKKKEEAVSRDPAAEGSARAVSSGGRAPAANVDEMIRASYGQLGADHFVAKVTIEYVRADGTLDPTYGEVTLETGKRRPPKPPKPADDPNRPIGAPEPVVPIENDYMDYVMAKCPRISWSKGEMRTERESSCSMFASRELLSPRCTVFEILAKAAAAGAPANALAKIEFSTTFGEPTGQSWSLSIDDNPRDIHFRQEGTDECAPIAEKP